MTTLADLVLMVGDAVTEPIHGAATGGSTTTLVDTRRSEADDYFTGGVLCILSGNNAGKTVEITDWDQATHTFTFTTQTAACAAADKYAAIPAGYPRPQIIRAINQALEEIPVPTLDTSLTTTGDQEAYQLPTGVRNILRLEVASSLTTPYDYIENNQFTEIDGYLYFYTGCEPTVDDYKIRLLYNGSHDEMDGDTDTLDASIHPERIKWNGAKHLLLWRVSRTEGRHEHINNLYNQAQQMAMVVDGRYKPPGRRPTPKYARW